MQSFLRFVSFGAVIALAACSASSSDSGNPGGGDDTGTPGTDSGGDDGGGDTSTPTDTGGGGDTGTPGGDTGVPTGDTGTPPTDTGGGGDVGPSTGGIKTVFIILMENHNWSAIKGSSSAPYINGTLLPASSSCSAYFNPPGIHPSEPNYLWLEAGDNFGITNDNSPSTNHQAAKDHLVSQLEGKGISWKSYQEDMTAGTCPLKNSGLYAPKHNPMVYFDDVTDTNLATSAHCIAHVRPYTELAGDLGSGKIGRYNFITPNLCNDMHGAAGCPSDSILTGDTWLSKEVPGILASAAYKDHGALFIVWDEATSGDGPIGMIVLSPQAKGGGYVSSVHFTHGSTLRTMEEIFGVPLLRDAAAQTSLKDLFTIYP